MVVFIIMKELIREILNDYISENLLLERRYFEDEISFNRDSDKKLVIFYNDHALESIGIERAPIEDIMEVIYEHKDDFFDTVKKGISEKKTGIIILNYFSPIPPYNDGFDFHCWLERPQMDRYVVIINTSIYHRKGHLKIRDNSRVAFITTEDEYLDNVIPTQR
jgi:hypothetical protein